MCISESDKKAFLPMEKGFLLSGQMAKAQYAENKKKMKHPLRSAVTTTAGAWPEPGACGVPTACAKSSSAVRSSASPTRSPSWFRDTCTCTRSDQYVKQRIGSARLFRRGIQHHRHRRRASPWGHDGMLYSLPSREIIADSVEYMANAIQGRRTGLHLELRQDHPGHADGRHAARHPDRLRIGRARWRRGISASGRST